MPNPINPILMSWLAPITSADGTALKDLAGYEIHIRALASGPILKSITQASTVQAPTPGLSVVHGSTSAPIYQELALPDGSYLATVLATDTAGNKSVESLSVPFDSNVVPPAAPTSVSLS